MYIYVYTHTHEYNEQKNASKCLGTAHNIKSKVALSGHESTTHILFFIISCFMARVPLWPISYEAKVIVAKMLKAKNTRHKPDQSRNQ